MEEKSNMKKIKTRLIAGSLLVLMLGASIASAKPFIRRGVPPAPPPVTASATINALAYDADQEIEKETTQGDIQDKKHRHGFAGLSNKRKARREKAKQMEASALMLICPQGSGSGATNNEEVQDYE